MIVSALLTSVGINLALCILFFTLYSVLRKQPGNIEVYAPRLVAEGKARRRGGEFNIEDLLPSPGWVQRAWQPSEDDLLASCGLDAVVFMRIFIFSLRVFTVAGIIGVFVLVPVNYLGDQLSDIDFADIPSKSLDLFSISNVKDGSNRLWVHFSAAYLISAVVCYLLYAEFKYISLKRLAYYSASSPQPHHFTILVRGIPAHDGSSVGDAVENFFTEYHPSTYLSHVVVRRTRKLRDLMTDAENLYKRLAHLKSRPHTSEHSRRSGFIGMFRQNGDLVRQYSKKLEDLETNLRIEQSDASLRRVEVPAAFVCFRSRYGAAAALHIQQSVNPTQWVTEQAPEPRDIYWPFFSASFMQRWVSKLVVYVASFILTIIFLLPVAIVQALTNLDQLETMFPPLVGILEITVVSQVITGYLPSLILHLFLSFVPPIMKLFSTMQGFIALSEIEKSACNKMLWFTIWNIFFANVLAGSISSRLEIFYDPKTIPSKLAVLVPAQLLNVYMPKYETGGKFWPIVHNSTIFSLILMQAIAFGIFSLKKLPVASSLILPLPVLTLLFNDYCRKRFLPVFHAYPAETLIKKDREDQNDPSLNEFLDGVVNTYRDPALMPRNHSQDRQEWNSPLLSHAY
ncbi:Calcium-dependent channel 7TM region putative phosphate domain-containing protein [Dioscorea alata]|uniref:Calcium-dependent channel 7TM region putative phosphate domain-containing protein n=1 Tax=Dioscorea alata TaxID=55571 RepID=A0ACB7UJZ1_DIOAL|nr:Calcium-dependent channel 7TM region putative phosphate domain-containing protein [Dioscorea alata]